MNLVQMLGTPCMGPNDCMSQDFFNSLNDRGAISSIVYVCGWGWTIPGASASGSGSGSVSRPGCSCGCCSYDLCSCISSGSGSGCGCGCGCGSNGSSGCGSGSDNSHSCACSCYYCGAYGCGAGSGSGGSSGSGSGSGSGSTDDDYRKLEEARKPENIRKNEKVKEAIRTLWKAMTDSAADKKRQEVGCYIYYRPADGQYYIGKTQKGEVVSKETQASIYLGSSLPAENNVPKDAICITSCHTHTALLDGSFDDEREVGPSPSDRADVNSSGREGDYRIVLDYQGHFVTGTGKYFIFPRNNIYGTPMIYIHYRDKDKVNEKDRVEKFLFNE